ncbi:MAG: hypothetical protein KKF48_01520 [Nanoarchaeota archaeon]|nr:hypothetical protein [Nanoarchaeota archaeon]MBU1027701.1 hypothetical protein [Nanoarchaeota archaeon]
MEKRILIILIVIWFMGVVSAAYGCTEGEVTSEKDFINLGEIEPISKLKIVLISGTDTAADIIVDAKKLTLTNLAPSKEIEILKGEYNVSIINSTEEFAWIKVGGGKEEINLKEVKKTGGLEIYISSLDGSYPGTANIDLFVGAEYFFLYRNEMSKKATIGGIEYAVELISPFSSGAMIEVSYCENGTLVKVNDSIEVNTNNSDSTNTSIQNDSSENTPQNTSSNDSLNTNEGNDSIIENMTGDDLEDKTLNTSTKNISIVISAITILVIIVILIFFYRRTKAYDKGIKSQNPTESVDKSEF